MSDTYRLPLEDEPPPIKGQLPHPYSTQIITDLAECQRLWLEFSPYQTPYDTWEFRQAFYLAYQHQPYFVLVKWQDISVGLWPLWWDSDTQRYDWFGSSWAEHQTFWIKDRQHLPALLAALPRPAKLGSILPTQVNDLCSNSEYVIGVDEPNFYLDLTPFKNTDEYLASLKKKYRYNIKRDWQAINELQPKLVINRFSDINLLIELLKNRFEDKGQTAAEVDERRAQSFRNLVILGLENPASYQLRMISVEIGDQIAVVDLILIFNQVYYPLKGGSNVKDFPGIGNYINLMEIQDALDLGMNQVDFLQIDYGWKHKWFAARPMASLCKF